MRLAGPPIAAFALMLVGAVISPAAAQPPLDAELAKRAFAEQVEGSLAVAQFEAAAGLAEQYATRYPDDRETAAMLATAYQLRLGLDHTDLASAALERLDDAYRRSSPARPELLRARIELVPEDERLPLLLQRFLERHGETLEPDERAVLTARLAQSRWRNACERGFRYDLCLSQFVRVSNCAHCLQGPRWLLARKRKPPPQPDPPRCAPPPRSFVRGVFGRNRGLTEAAQRGFAAVLAADGVEIADPDRRAAFEAAVAMSALYLADAQFEGLLALERPADLRFAFAEPPAGGPKRRWYLEQLRTRERSLQRLRHHLERTDRLARELERRYEEIVVANRSTAWTIAALARIAQVSAFRADLAFAVNLPEGTRPGDVAAYCELARAYAEPLYRRSIAAYARCLEASVTDGVFTEYTETCEEAVTTFAPRRFPALDEVYGRPDYTASRPESLGLQLDPGLDGE